MTVTGLCGPDRECHRQFERRADRERERRVVSRNPSQAYDDLRTVRRGGTGNRNRPSRSVTVVATRFVWLFRAVTWAPGTTAPDGSVTRPLTLA